MIKLIWFLEFLSHLIPGRPTSEGHLIKGCSFKFHQNLSGFASFLVSRKNGTLYKEVKASLKKSSDEDTYEFSSLLLTSYIGHSVQCKLYDEESMKEIKYSINMHVNMSGM